MSNDRYKKSNGGNYKDTNPTPNYGKNRSLQGVRVNCDENPFQRIM